MEGETYKNGQELRTRCPFHSDKHPSCSINLETGVWICYAGCGGGDWISFVERVRRDPEYAPLEELKPVPEISSKPVLKSLLERHFTREILAKWGIEWDPKMGAMRLPVYNRKGGDEGSIWRYPEGIHPKYRYAVGFSRNKVLYGVWRLPAHVPQIVLVEGPLDAIWVQEAGIPAVAILGSSLSEQQAQLVYELRPARVLLCFDNDEAGYKARQQAVPLLQKQGCWVYKTRLPKNVKDIQEVPNAKVASVIENAELCVNGKGLVHPKYRRWFDKSSKLNSGIWRN